MRKSVLAILLLAVAPLLADEPWPQITLFDEPVEPRVIPNGTGGFSLFLPVVTKVRGASTSFYTSIDITNHHATAASDVLFNYTSADSTINVNGTLVALARLQNFHSDDVIQTLADAGAISSSQAASTYGTMTLTFPSASFTTGREASAIVRIYNYVAGASGPSIGLAYRGTLLRAGGSHRLTSIISDTDFPGVTVPSLVTNLGVANTGINEAGELTTSAASVTLTFIDPVTGNTVGSQPTFSLGPRQVAQLNDIFGQFAIPGGMRSLIVDVAGPTGTTAPVLEGYVVLKDTATNDGSYFAMQGIPPPPPPANYTGTWTGTTNEGKEVGFTIANDEVTSFKMGFSFGGGGATCDTTITITYGASNRPRVQNGGFSLTFSPTGLNTAISVSFASSTQASGTFGQVTMNNYKCGPLTINGFKSGGTFTATK